MNNEQYIQHTLNLAKQGWPFVSPNPMVGCVIVNGEKIVAEGFHKKYGEAHAEANAINALNKDLDPKNCTLYVNLEPCSHQGKTPPCADLIISKGFKKVVICNLDPNPLVAGKGIAKLRQAGIEVVTGILEKEGFELNKRFFTFHTKHRPYFILKWAQTADGFISRSAVPNNSEAERNSLQGFQENKIGNEEQQKRVHQMRAEETAILVGKNTVLFDDPFLTTRLVKGKNPTRIFIDKDLEVLATFNIYNKEAETLVFSAIKDDVKENICFIKIDFSKNVLAQISQKLYELKIQSVMVEGGAFLLNSFINEKMADEAVVFVNENLKFNTGVKAPEINLPIKFEKLGEVKLFKIRLD